MDTTPNVTAMPSRIPLPLWQIQLINAAGAMADDLESGHDCDRLDGVDPSDLAGLFGQCDACFWRALYNSVPDRVRVSVTQDIANGVPTMPLNMAPRR